MAIAESMKGITEGIVASYDARIKAVKDLVADTRKTIKGFAQDREKMSEELQKSLADFVADLTKNVENMIKGFQKEHKDMADTLKDSLEKGEADRLKNFKDMMGGIQKEIKAIEKYVTDKLKEFDESHAEMSEQQKKDLAKYVGDIVSSVKKLLGEYGSDMGKARATWQGMAASLSKSRKGGVMPRIEAGERVTTVEEAVEKPAKKRGRKKKK